MIHSKNLSKYKRNSFNVYNLLPHLFLEDSKFAVQCQQYVNIIMKNFSIINCSLLATEHLDK